MFDKSDFFNMTGRTCLLNPVFANMTISRNTTARNPCTPCAQPVHPWCTRCAPHFPAIAGPRSPHRRNAQRTLKPRNILTVYSFTAPVIEDT